MIDIVLMRRLSGLADLSDADIAAARAASDRRDDDGPQLEAAGPQLSDVEIAALVSDEAKLLVIEYEVTSKSYYEKHYVRAEWPGGPSGITIGVGYDLGYNGEAAVRDTWRGLIADDAINTLCRACGLKGSAAHNRLSEFRGVQVPWDAAQTAFSRSTLPQEGRKVLQVFPNATELKGHAFGALLSLVYNRGTATKGPGRQHMANIAAHMQKREFTKIPGEFRAMKALWPTVRGLQLRREAEARLFERGLEQLAMPVALATPAPAPAAGELKTESVVKDRSFSLADLDGDGSAYDDAAENSAGTVMESARGHEWDDVSWASSDAVAPDYRHLEGLGTKGAVFEFNSDDFETLLALNAFEPDRSHGKVIFALRGAELVSSATAKEAEAHLLDKPSLLLREVRPNHFNMRCVIGVYDINSRTLSGFKSSTVPNRRAVASYVATHVSGNMMPTGMYRLEVGWHHASKPSRIPGCLIENGRQKAVLRSDHPYYDTKARWEDNPLHGDNLHPATSDPSADFSSYGCLVVDGSYKADGDRAKGRHVGEWALFRKALGLQPTGTIDHGKQFDVVLLTGLDASLAHDLNASSDTDKNVRREKLRRFRQGSSGAAVKRIQEALKLPQTGILDHGTAKALADAQRRASPDKSADGIYAPQTETVIAARAFEATPVQVSLAGSAAPKLESLERSADNETEAKLADLEYQLGLYAAQMNGPLAGQTRLESAGGGQLELLRPESLSLGRFLDLQTWLGTGGIRELGASLARNLEQQLHAYVCAPNAIDQALDQTGIRAQVDQAAAKGTAALKRLFVDLLRQVCPSFMPSHLIETGVDFISVKLIEPYASALAPTAAQQINLGADWLCTTWKERLTEVPAETAQAAQLVNTAVPPPDANAPLRVPLFPGRCDPAIDQSLPPSGAPSQFKAQVDTTQAMPGSYTSLVIGVIDASNKKPLDENGLKSALDALNKSLMANGASVAPVVPEYKMLKALRGVRRHSELTDIADRMMTRDPALRPRLITQYAQGLIDSGRVMAGIEVLERAIDQGGLYPNEIEEARGILGRGHKQIYVNHVTTRDQARTYGRTYAGHLQASLDNYGAMLDLDAPGKHDWHAINYIAVLDRARRDGIGVVARTEPQVLAKKLIAELEKKLAEPDAKVEAWTLATLGEAYLAIGQLDKSAEYYGRYAVDPGVDAFQLNGTIRQLQEVWQIEPGSQGEGAIVTGLLTALAGKEQGLIPLSAQARHVIETSQKVQYSKNFETRTKDGRFVDFSMLKSIVRCGSSVAAMQRPVGALGETEGTGFLVKGADFGLPDGPNDSYVLTNAHVLWDHDPNHPNAGPNESALTPKNVQIVFENDLIDGNRRVYSCRKVIWQSPVSMHDATLVQLDRRADGIRPLDLADTDLQLVASDAGSGTKLLVIGHTGGRNLAIGVSGSLEQMQGSLLEKAPKPGTEAPVFLRYRTPTEGGNSGSPVLDVNSWSVVGLHHAGFTSSGGMKKLTGGDGMEEANEGIFIGSISAAAKASIEQRKALAAAARARESGGAPLLEHVQLADGTIQAASYFLFSSAVLPVNEIKAAMAEHGTVLIGFDAGGIPPAGPIKEPSVKTARDLGAELEIYVEGPGGPTGSAWSEDELERVKLAAESIGIDTRGPLKQWRDTKWDTQGWKDYTFRQLAAYKALGFNAAEIDNIGRVITTSAGLVDFFKEYQRRWQGGKLPQLVLKNLSEADMKSVVAAVTSRDLDRNVLSEFHVCEDGTGYDATAIDKISSAIGIRTVRSKNTFHYSAKGQFGLDRQIQTAMKT